MHCHGTCDVLARLAQLFDHDLEALVRLLGGEGDAAVLVLVVLVAHLVQRLEAHAVGRALREQPRRVLLDELPGSGSGWRTLFW